MLVKFDDDITGKMNPKLKYVNSKLTWPSSFSKEMLSSVRRLIEESVTPWVQTKGRSPVSSPLLRLMKPTLTQYSADQPVIFV